VAESKKRQRDVDNESTDSPDGSSSPRGITPAKQPATKRARDRTPGTPFCRVDVEAEIEEHVKSGKDERFLNNTYEGAFGGKIHCSRSTETYIHTYIHAYIHTWRALV
jgi:hypothetical protein